MNYLTLCLLVFVGILTQAAEFTSIDYDFYQVLLDPKKVDGKNLIFLISQTFDSIAVKCDNSVQILATEKSTSTIEVLYTDRQKMGCSEREFNLGLTYNTQVQTIEVQVIGDSYIHVLKNNTYINTRYKFPIIPLLYNKYTVGYLDLNYQVRTSDKYIYIEMFYCDNSGSFLNEIKEDGTIRKVYSEKHNYYDTIEASTVNYAILGGYKYDQVNPQYWIKYQEYNQDKTIPYDRIYVSNSAINYSQQNTDMIFNFFGISTSLEYTNLYYFVIIGESIEVGNLRCYIGLNDQKASDQIRYDVGYDKKNAQIKFESPDPKYNMAIAYVQMRINGVTITKEIGSTKFSYSQVRTQFNILLLIFIILIVVFVIIFAIVRYKMKSNQKQMIKDTLDQSLVHIDADAEEAQIQQTNQIN